MSLAVGILMALGVGIMATLLRLDRDRAMYPVVMIVIAFLYVLFAVIGGGGQVLVIELVAASVFVALALAGFRGSLWLVVVALAGHGLFDAVHPRLYVNVGVPPWWPSFCAAYDVVAAVYLAYLLASQRLRSREVTGVS